MSLLIGWIIFITALLVSITLHEAGHLVTAKKFGMKATQFFAGFGPTLWSRKRERPSTASRLYRSAASSRSLG